MFCSVIVVVFAVVVVVFTVIVVVYYHSLHSGNKLVVSYFQLVQVMLMFEKLNASVGLLVYQKMNSYPVSTEIHNLL